MVGEGSWPDEAAGGRDGGKGGSSAGGGGAGGSSSAGPGIEPLSCVSCRARKLKCDRTKPACTRCIRVEQECVYPESRRKPTFKRRNVKELEARLAQVEDFLKEVNNSKNSAEAEEDDGRNSAGNDQSGDLDEEFDFNAPQINTHQSQRSQPPPQRPQQKQRQQPAGGTMPFPNEELRPEPGTQSLVELGMSETLPPFEMIEELTNNFFQQHTIMAPVVHPGRYYQAFYGAPLRKPPMCLQYAIWAISAGFHSTYNMYAELFYERARAYATADEMKGRGEQFVTIPHAQAWVLITTYEARSMLFTRASASGAKAIRLAHMMGLHRMDQPGSVAPSALGPATSWAEEDERRRVLWGVYTIDAHTCISTGFPSLIHSDEIYTRLPASEEAFVAGQKEETSFLKDVFAGAQYAGFTAIVITCHVYKSILQHVHDPKQSDRPEDIVSGPFWVRHRDLDNKLSSLFMFLPERYRLPQNMREPSSVITNMNLHAAVICLHHAAIDAIQRHGHPQSLKQSSICRLKASGEEIANIIKAVPHSPTIFKTPLSGLALYLALSAFIYLGREESGETLSEADIDNIETLFRAMEAIGRVHEITRAFLHQAYLDIERNDLAAKLRLPNLRKITGALGLESIDIPIIARGAMNRPDRVAPASSDGTPAMSSYRLNMVSRATSQGTDKLLHSLLQTERYQPMLEAMTRNITPRDWKANMSQRPRGFVAMQQDIGSSASATATTAVEEVAADTNPARQSFRGLRGDQGSLAAAAIGSKANLAGRTTSSSMPWWPMGADPDDETAEPPADAGLSGGSGPGTAATTTQTGSSGSGSGASPLNMGLGNTLEENRVDLRPFRGRIATPLWPSMDVSGDDMFEDMVQAGVTDVLAMDTSESWGILTSDIDWGDKTNNGDAMIG